MGVLVLLRHGQASLGEADYDQLSVMGHRQARLAGQRLARSAASMDRIISGGLARQRDTAEGVMTELGVPSSRLIVDDRLDEYDHVSVMADVASNASFETAKTPSAARAVQSALDEAIARWAAADSGYPESHDAFIGRVMGALDEMVQLPGTTLAVTSAGVIACICCRVLGLPLERWSGLARLVVNVSLTKLITGRTGTHLLTFNDHAHLESDRSLITYR